MNFKRFGSLLPDNPLCGIDAYKDELNLASGECTRNIKKKVFNGSENWTLYNGNFFSGVTDSNSKESRAVICSHIVSPDGIIVGSGSARLKVIKSKLPSFIATTDDFKDWITEQYNNDTPFTVWYILETPTTETITVPSGLSGTEEGYLNQSGTPTTINPIYPTANTVEKWFDINHYIHNTSTDTITTPADIYANDTTATVGLKGNTVQNGTPSPSNPVDVNGVGESETIGEHSGQYKIPILCSNQTTNIYLGETQSTRVVKKLVLTGEENWESTDPTGYYRYFRIPYFVSAQVGKVICTHYISPDDNISVNNKTEGTKVQTSQQFDKILIIRPPEYATWGLTDFTNFLATQYANGTPVTVWYVLATPETGIVNEPLMKIGDYADEVSGVSIPTIAGANTLSVDTTLQPREVSVNYKGWHPVADVHERENGAWT